MEKKKKWLKWVAWILLTPVLLFVLLMILLYVPPVQNFLRKQITSIASESTGMDISVERIDLRFPLNLLVRGVQVIQPADVSAGVMKPDTLLTLESLNVHVQAWPLLRGQVEVDDITLNQATVNTSNLVDGMLVKGVLGNFSLKSHGINLMNETVVLNDVELADTHLQVMLADTIEAVPDTTSTPVNWKVKLNTMRLKNISVGLDMPLDSMQLAARLEEVGLEDATVDLGRQLYGWRRFQLAGATLTYDSGSAQPAEGFDASHIALRDIRIGVDSVLYHGRDMSAVIREFSMNERSGLSVTSLTGRLLSDSTVIRVPSLQLQTPNSEMNLTAQTYWELVDIPTTGRLSARFNAFIGKQDVLLFAGGLPDSFKESYPFRPLVIHAGTEGNLKQMQISRFTADLPGAFSLSGGGELWNLTDSLTRTGTLDFEMQTHDLNFLADLAGTASDGSFIIPDSMNLGARLDLEGSRYTAQLKLNEGHGLLDLNAFYDTSAETYEADLVIDSLQLHHFLPKDSLYLLSAKVRAKGQGTDFTSYRTKATVQASLDRLQYGPWNVSGVHLDAGLKSQLATVSLTSDNALLQMQADADMRLDRRYLDGKLKMDVAQLDLHKLGIAPQPLKRPFAFAVGAEARRDSIKLNMNAGDLKLNFRAENTLKHLLDQSDRFMKELTAQIDNRKLDHAALRELLPSAGMYLTAGKENPVSYYLATKNISYNDFSLGFGFTPEIGINGRTALHGLHVDSLQLDTLFFAIAQDTTRMKLQGGIVNAPSNPQFAFRSTLTGEIRSEDAELTADFVDGEGRTGLLFGINARPLTEGNGKGNGVLFRLTPSEPVIAFRKFHFADEANWLYLHKDMRLYANVDMDSDDGMCFRMQSARDDTVSLQNMNIELDRFRLSELTAIMPYMPRITGLFSAEAHYVQTATSLQLSAEANIKQLTYEKQPVGDVGLGATWLPGETGQHYLNSYLMVNDEEVMTADGTLTQKGEKESLDVMATLERFPLQIANAFVPDRMVQLSGHVGGGLHLEGSLDTPVLNGDISLDSVSVYARQAGAKFWFDNRPIRFENNRLLFNQFAIYTTSRNPFTIDGNVDFRDMSRPTADLNLRAKNYTLLDAPRTRESLVYGKVCVDLMATVRGPLDALVMRGNMNLLSNTDVTYVMTDSPLTVQDRLDGLVTFTSFSDTTTVRQAEVPTLSLGGMDMVVSVHIDNSVQLRADLNPDRSNYVVLEGGGDLTLQYTPMGDMNLNGRYTLSGGRLKYSLPVIPLEEFQLTNGSYVEWRGDLMNPILNLKATERKRASVASDDNGGSRMVSFDVSISIKNRLEAPDLVFDITAPEDATVENELQAMGAEERSTQAIAMLATGVYMKNGGKGGGLNMGAALNSVLQSQINALAGSAFEKMDASFSVGIEDRTAAETGEKQTDVSFRYSQRFFNDRVQIVIGGKVSTGANATNDVESFIDNISLEYRLDASGTRYVRVFHNKNYESILDGEITETGVGLVLRRKMDRLGELFIFKRNKKKDEKLVEE